VRKESTKAHVPTPCYGYAMLISHKRGETAVHGCHCRGDMVLRMRRVSAIPRIWYVCFTAFFALIKVGRECCCGVCVESIVCCLSMFFKAFTKCAFSFTYILFFTSSTLDHIIMLGLLSPTSKVMFNLSCFPVLVKVYDVFPWLMNGQVRQSCRELQRDVLAGSFGFLSSFASFARTSRSRRFGERRKAKKGTYLKMLLSVRWIAEWVVSCE